MDSKADDFEEPARLAVELTQRNEAIRWLDKHLVLVDSFDSVVLNDDKLLMAMMQHSLATLGIELAKCSEQLEMLETMYLDYCDCSKFDLSSKIQTMLMAAMLKKADMM